MIFLGTTFLGGEYTSLPTPTHITKMDYVELLDAKYSKLYITKDVQSTPSIDEGIEWNWDTVLYADYSNETTNAGNMDWTVETVSDIVVKRRIYGEFDWTTIDIRHINTEEDFNIIGIDRFNQSVTDYEYALVPYLNDNPGVYIIKSIYSEFDDAYIIERNKYYKIISTDNAINTIRNIPGNHNNLLDSRYPVFFHSGKMNYDTGSVTGKFFDLENDCRIMTKDKSYAYKRGLMDFLTDGEPKILKTSDGRIWLIQVIPSPSDNSDNTYEIRNISFDWVEIGNYRSTKDLYYANLIDLEQKWWD